MKLPTNADIFIFTCWMSIKRQLREILFTGNISIVSYNKKKKTINIIYPVRLYKQQPSLLRSDFPAL